MSLLRATHISKHVVHIRCPSTVEEVLYSSATPCPRHKENGPAMRSLGRSTLPSACRCSAGVRRQKRSTVQIASALLLQPAQGKGRRECVLVLASRKLWSLYPSQQVSLSWGMSVFIQRYHSLNIWGVTIKSRHHQLFHHVNLT